MQFLEKMQLMESSGDWSGFRRVNGERRPADWKDRVGKMVDLIEGRFNGTPLGNLDRQIVLREAMQTADFPLVFGDAIYRRMLARYLSLGRVLDPIFMRATMPDFRTGKLFRIDGTTKRLQVVGEKGEYLLASRNEEKYEVTLAKYGKKFDLSWEAWVNDDLGIFNAIADDLADSAINTEAWFQTATFWDANGPLDAYFNHATEGQTGVSALTLTIDNLYTARAQMLGAAAGFRSRHGEPFKNTPRYLVVNPMLEDEARQILFSTEVRWTESAGGAATQRGTLNVAQQLGIQLIVDPWIPVVVTTGTLGQTTWALFSADIQAAAIARLQGRENPELFMKSPDQQRIGGGATTPFDGDFDTDNILWKVRHPLGTTTLDPRAGWASDGQ